jgi:hypothetical protein
MSGYHTEHQHPHPLSAGGKAHLDVRGEKEEKIVPDTG